MALTKKKLQEAIVAMREENEREADIYNTLDELSNDKKRTYYNKAKWH